MVDRRDRAGPGSDRARRGSRTTSRVATPLQARRSGGHVLGKVLRRGDLVPEPCEVCGEKAHAHTTTTRSRWTCAGCAGSTTWSTTVPNVGHDIPWRGRDYGKYPAAFDRDAYVYACAQVQRRRERRCRSPASAGTARRAGAPDRGLTARQGGADRGGRERADNCVLFWRDGKVHTSVIGADAREHIGEMQIPIHHNHFATCVAAEQFRHRTE